MPILRPKQGQLRLPVSVFLTVDLEQQASGSTKPASHQQRLLLALSGNYYWRMLGLIRLMII